ncbi:MAG: hypothetical protein K6G56_00920 [Clostridiales bacterium]|nr:hypothetical protein [Clostridiales bacterium]
MSFTYEYDEANQLIRENLYYGSGNTNNATYTYEYDDWGNILGKKKYAYTTDTLGVVIETIASELTSRSRIFAPLIAPITTAPKDSRKESRRITR